MEADTAPWSGAVGEGPGEAVRDRSGIRPRLAGPASHGVTRIMETTLTTTEPASGEKTKARDILAAIETLQQIEHDERPATTEERQVLARFGGFGAVARSLFPNPATDLYKDAGWEVLGHKLESLITPAEYDSAKRTTFTAYYTSPTVMTAMHQAIAHLGVPEQARVLEPGCGTGNFLKHAEAGMRFIGVELDSLSGRIARALHPEHDIRIESFADTKIADGSLDAVIGNPPFADIRLDYRGTRLPLHDFFFAKSLDALKPGGVLALVTSHYTLDKHNAAGRELIAAKADFLAAIRLPSEAFKHEGTSVVTDIVFLRRRAAGEAAAHADPAWLEVGPLAVDGVEVAVNRYFLNHPEQVLGSWSRQDRLYGGEAGYSVKGSGDLASQLQGAVQRLPGRARERPVAQLTPVTPEFMPPPVGRHIAEGSFFVAEDRTLHQVENGQGVPVVYGGTTLRADGTMTGRRLAGLIGLRDQARRVLASQNEGWPEPHRVDARRALNRSYDRFAAAYGPINKTSFGEIADGSITRRMPNIVKFKEDPDAMIVLALEDYDEITAKAVKAPILLRDVVGKSPPVISVASAEEGLLVSLDRTGGVDLGLIAGLYGKPEEAVQAELHELIYRDPASGEWQTADVYLSGNVREKLAVAASAGADFARNAAALREVQPEDVLPGDIDAGLGAPWMPAADLQAFAATLFRVQPCDVAVTHLKKDALWNVEPTHAALASVAATAEYGTARANGTGLLELALNLKTPVIYDQIDRDQRVINQDETLAAREKQKLIKEKFKTWVFAEPDRTERLVRSYNDIYNNLRPRLFDGSHLDFPGMTQGITLRDHQKDAIWRGMSSGNTLLAHAVGAGKTFTMAATGMKLRQAGLVQKPMFVVPNHMLEQFAREFMQLYPNARLLIAAKEDLARDRRKLLTARIANGEWDGIIVTHSSFERIGLSGDYQQRFLREQIAEYDELLRDHAGGSPRNLIKTIEKQKARREERLKDLAAGDKKDDGLVFDELGVDHVFIDEAHFFKNLETPTKMDRVAGIQTGGSERAFDIYMKARYLGEKHPGHGVTFATGTPISNTMVELYTMQRFLDPEGLRSRGIEHFDGWAGTFGEVVDTMEISPDGSSLRPRSRFAKFINLPELQQMFRAFADVQTAEMLQLPTPELEGGKPQIVACPMSDAQAELQQALVARYERLRSEKVDPRVDNALAITTDGRKLALDARLLSPDAGDDPRSKINALTAAVTATWQQSTPTRGTQLIFCDMGVNPTLWGFCVYDEVIAKLTAGGIPREQIASIGDADTDAKKQSLFDRVRSGSVRVLIGSTAKMGTGTNVQKRLVALHHLDAPWKPAEVEQREGRILRQGNENRSVAIARYVTQGSFDSYMWQALETKARFIAQVITGENAARRAEDVGGQELSYAEVKAIASGNPAVLTLAEADAELQRLAVLERSHANEQFLARRSLRDLPETIARLADRRDRLTADLGTVTAHTRDRITVGEQECAAEQLTTVLSRRLNTIPDIVPQLKRFPIGRYRGLDYGLVVHPRGLAEVYLEGAIPRHNELSREHQGPRAVLNALERIAAGYRGQIELAKEELAIAEGQRRDHAERLGKPFPHEAYYDALAEARNQLKAGLSQPTGEPARDAVPVAELAERIKALRAANSIEAAPARTEARRMTGEEPIAARIRRRHPPQVMPSAPAAEPKRDQQPVPEGTSVAEIPDQAEQTPNSGNTGILPFSQPTPPLRPQLTTSHRQAAGNRRDDGRQLSLF